MIDIYTKKCIELSVAFSGVNVKGYVKKVKEDIFEFDEGSKNHLQMNTDHMIITY